MAVQVVPEAKYIASRTLCDSCSLATSSLCIFMQASVGEAEQALVDMGADAIATPREGTRLLKVIACPLHKQGRLPSLHGGARKKIRISSEIVRKYDLSCPECGSARNVKVAGAREMPCSPQDWYCRCTSCNKSFRPRKREEKSMEVYQSPKKNTLEVAREKLTRDDYIRLKNKGLTDKEIAAKINVDHNTIYRLKKEWGLVGQLDFRHLEGKTQEARETQELPDTDLDDIEFFEPRTILDIPILNIRHDCLTINACAVKAMQAKYLRIGASKEFVVLVPSEDKAGCYTCRHSGKNATKIGGNRLVEFLVNHGFEQGRYLLRHNPEKNRWEARINERI